jgi:hypothetical protein
MSPISGYLTPESRATIDAVFAKLAAPGMCNPDDSAACVGGTPSQEAIERDARSAGQRNHDALNAAGRALLASGELGQHNGLPASIIVTTTLRELEAATGKGLTGGGALLPMSDVIRLASHAHHYLAIFRQGEGARALSHQTAGLVVSESCCTPGIVGVRRRVAARRAITAKSITARPTPNATPPTSTT